MSPRLIDKVKAAELISFTGFGWKALESLLRSKTADNLASSRLEVIQAIQNGSAGTENYLRDWDLFLDFPEARSNFRISIDLKSDSDSFPGYIWLYAGSTGTYSSKHVDTHFSAAWCLLFDGIKRWWFWQPGLEEPTEPPQLELIQKPGEIVLVPAGWWHEVVNLDTSLSMTGNYINTQVKRQISELKKLLA